MRSLHPLVVVAIAIGAACLGGGHRQRLLPAHRLHDVRLLSVRGWHERAGRLRGPEIARTSRPICCRRLRRGTVVDQLRSERLVGARRRSVIAGLCGVLIAWPSLRVRGPYLAMVTLAFGIVVEKLVSEWTEVFGGAEGIYGIKPLALAGVPFANLQWVWFGIVLGAVTHLLLRNLLTGRFGRAFLSLQADEIAAESVGVSVYRYKILAFVIAAVTCGIAGAMVAQQNQYLNSDFISFQLSIFILLLVLVRRFWLAVRAR